MKKFWMTLVFGLVVTMAACTTNTIPPIDETPSPNDELPIDYSRLYNPFGFSSLVITSRSTYEDQITLVSTTIEFLDALMDSTTKVIHIEHDLSLGSKEVSEALANVNKTLSMYSTVYRAHSKQPLTHPILLESGVGQIRLTDRNDLMIYSSTGVEIKHAGFLIERSSNIVIRNIHLSELWEWDEYSQGQYKRNDWDYFSLKDVNGIWFDHLTFDQVYDGIIDLRENAQHITLSWSKLNFISNDFIDAQIDYLENNRSMHPYYDALRNEAISVEDLKVFASFQKKGFNLGNTTDGSGFENITMTFHHLEVFNLMDRMPRLRKGDVHLYHMILDNTLLYEYRLKLNSPNLSFVNQGLVSTEGGSILMEHSIYKFVTTPIKNHQDTNPDVKYTGSYSVINSEMIQPNRTYFGSTNDRNSLWIHTGSAAMIPFQMRNYSSIPYSYVLEDVYYLAETFETFPTGAQKILDFDWLYMDLTLSIKGD